MNDFAEGSKFTVMEFFGECVAVGLDGRQVVDVMDKVVEVGYCCFV